MYSQSIIYSFFILILSGLFLPAAAQPLRLSQQEAISLAVKNNRQLKVSQIDISRAQQQTRIVQSKTLPSVNLGGQYSHYFDEPVFFGFGNNTGSDKIPYSRIGGEDQFSAILSGEYSLYDPALRPALKQARLSEESNHLAYSDREIDIVTRVKQIYLGILVVEERLKLQYESLNRNEVALKDARYLFLQGRALRVDTLRAYTTVKNLQPDILKLSNAIHTGKLQLTTLLGIDSVQEMIFTDSLLIPSADSIPSEAQVFEEAKELRPDLKILNLQQQISGQKIAIARAGKLPSVSLVGQYQLQTQANNFKFTNTYWPPVSFVGAQVRVPLFNGRIHESRIKEAELASRQSAIQLNDGYEQLKTEVRQVVSALHETAERVKTQVTVRQTAQLSYDIVQYRYSKGVASRLELTDAELALTTAQSNYLEAVYDYLSARIGLQRVTGKIEK